MDNNDIAKLVISLLILVVIPMFVIDSINILFKPFHIEKTIETWGATLFLLLIFKGNRK